MYQLTQLSHLRKMEISGDNQSSFNWVFYQPSGNRRIVFTQQLEGTQSYQWVKTQIATKLVILDDPTINKSSCGCQSVYGVSIEFQPNFLQINHEMPILTAIPDDWKKEALDRAKKILMFSSYKGSYSFKSRKIDL